MLLQERTAWSRCCIMRCLHCRHPADRPARPVGSTRSRQARVYGMVMMICTHLCTLLHANAKSSQDLGYLCSRRFSRTPTLAACCCVTLGTARLAALTRCQLSALWCPARTCPCSQTFVVHFAHACTQSLQRTRHADASRARRLCRQALRHRHQRSLQKDLSKKGMSGGAFP